MILRVLAVVDCGGILSLFDGEVCCEYCCGGIRVRFIPIAVLGSHSLLGVTYRVYMFAVR